MLTLAKAHLVSLLPLVMCVVDYFQDFEEARLQNTPSCPDPPPVANSYRWSTSVGVVYSCVEGYNFTGGGDTLVCETDGTWSGYPPVCTLDCGIPPILPGADMDNSSTGGVKYMCRSEFNQTTGAMVYCRTWSGSWGTPLVFCHYQDGISVDIPYPNIAETTTIPIYQDLTTDAGIGGTATGSADTSTDPPLSKSENFTTIDVNIQTTTAKPRTTTEGYAMTSDNVTQTDQTNSSLTVNTTDSSGVFTTQSPRAAVLESSCLLLEAGTVVFAMGDGQHLYEIVSLTISMETVSLIECTRPSMVNGERVWGVLYKGSLSVTASGLPCQHWADMTPHVHEYSDLNITTFPDANFDDVRNFCRNPKHNGVHRERPWCFTTNDSVTWEYCDVPECTPTTVEISTTSTTNLADTSTDQLCEITTFNRISTRLPVSMECEQPQATAPYGSHLKLEVKSSGDQDLYLCDLIPFGVDYESGCPEPPHMRSWELQNITGYAVNDTANYACALGYHHIQGWGTSQCLESRQWSTLGLECSDEQNLAQLANVQTPLQDGDDTTCVTAAVSISTPHQIILDHRVEVHQVSVVLGTDSLPDLITMEAKIEDGTYRECRDKTRTPYGYLFTCPGYPISGVLVVTVSASYPVSLCEVKVFGRNGDEALECRQTDSGTDYKGHINVTREGIPCMYWTEISNLTDLEFPDGNAAALQNFCRNPIRKSTGIGHNDFRPFCYYRGGPSLVGWNYCDVMMCQKTCRTSKAAMEYVGELTSSETPDGVSVSCNEWNTGNSDFRRSSDFGSERAANFFCRNPGRSQERPWCYTNTKTLSYEYCYIPVCPTVSSTPELEFDLNNQSEANSWKMTSRAFKSCFATHFYQGTYTDPIYESIMSSLCDVYIGKYKEVMCYVSDSPAQDYGDSVQWTRVHLMCPSNTETITTEIGTTETDTTTTEAVPYETTTWFYSVTDERTTGGFNESQPLCATSCAIVCHNNSNIPSTKEELQESVRQIQRTLYVDRTVLSKTIRTKKSANDQRPSSQVSGALAICLLALVVILMVSGDVISVIYFFYTLIKPKPTIAHL